MEIRDIRADYIAAHLHEYTNYKNAGDLKRAKDVAEVLKAYGVEVDKSPTGVKERAVPQEPLETAVEGDASPKRGRPKTAKKPAE